MKKILALLLTLTLLATLFTACTPSAPDAAPPEDGAPTEEEQPPVNEPDDSFVGESEIAPAPPEEVILYLPNENADDFEEISVEIEISSQNIVAALVDAGALPEGISVLSFRIDDHGVETQEGETVSYTPGDTVTLYIDLSEEMQSALLATGSAGEIMLLGSLTNTLLTVYDADELVLTCGGNPLESGHNVYDEPITFMNLSE